MPTVNSLYGIPFNGSSGVASLCNGDEEEKHLAMPKPLEEEEEEDPVSLE